MVSATLIASLLGGTAFAAPSATGSRSPSSHAAGRVQPLHHTKPAKALNNPPRSGHASSGTAKGQSGHANGSLNKSR